MKLKIGSRKSKLALIQTNLVINQIKKHFPDIECEIIPITTTGDIITDIALYDIGGKALFLKEIEQQLLDNKIDLAVHSLKDVPGILPKGLLIAAVLEREDPRDVFVSLKYKSIEELPKGTKVGSTSVRRKVFLHKMKHDVEVVIFRGNVDLRVNKLKAGDVDAAIIAAAGLKRLDIFNQKYCHILDPNQMLPAVGQGVIAIEIVEDNFKIREICNKINHQSTWHLICAERAFLEYLNADCKTPLAAYANYESTGIGVDFMMADFGGENIIFHKSYGEISEAKNMGIRAAQIMLDKMSKM